ncbi:Acyl-CoA N-acyltransferases (Nat) [Glarea lozoyensis ATCC 20868]|uniref:Acyl-CoA N-acyltransferases (Nat) n=1 Tax=Glarea lozoyensis (strain ATCC 20868 / MF5171) TaxID=1116229 RepID=S3CJT8_GLAL2|nr:Acyl-CoA N-acyltransferases (Nat) [Glarea lozoyensis ATCC 20868]EPE25504.1 Acyl-CoA N-acyltransferases (Nat) [Glarea lozoyensis ATCC 20868]
MANPTLTISPATPPDLPGIIEVWYASFNLLHIFPDTPIVKSWIAASMLRNIEGEDGGGTSFWVCKDGEGRVVGFARWFLEEGEVRENEEGRKRNGVTTWEERWIGDGGSLCEGVTREGFGNEFMEPMMRQHEVVMAGRKHYFLEILATHPDFRQMGVGSRLLEWGVKKADEEGLDIYLDGSKMGAALYEKFGWVAKREFMDPDAVSTPMLRPGKV